MQQHLAVQAEPCCAMACRMKPFDRQGIALSEIALCAMSTRLLGPYLQSLA